LHLLSKSTTTLRAVPDESRTCSSNR